MFLVDLAGQEISKGWQAFQQWEIPNPTELYTHATLDNVCRKIADTATLAQGIAITLLSDLASSTTTSLTESLGVSKELQEKRHYNVANSIAPLTIGFVCGAMAYNNFSRAWKLAPLLLRDPKIYDVTTLNMGDGHQKTVIKETERDWGKAADHFVWAVGQSIATGVFISGAVQQWRYVAKTETSLPPPSQR